MDYPTAVARLPGDYALAILLHDTGAEPRVIARRLGVDIAAIGPMLDLARAKLVPLLTGSDENSFRSPFAPAGSPARKQVVDYASVTSRAGRTLGDMDNDNRIEELQRSAETMAIVAKDKKGFQELVEAFRIQDAERFQALLDRAGVLQYCPLVCRYLCSKHIVHVCHKLVAGGSDSDKLDPEEWRQFAQLTARIAEEKDTLRRLVDVVDAEDAAGFKELVAKFKAARFAHQLCHWVSMVRCGWICGRMCPPPPLVTQVGLIPSANIASTGYAAGPSVPGGPTPGDSKSPGGVGDHPFGDLTNIKGVFNTPAATEYKVEMTPAAGGAPTAIIGAIHDYRFNPDWWMPGEPPYLFYDRAPIADWYTIAEMGLLGQDYLADWQTAAAVPDGAYDLVLTVRTAALIERVSPPVRVVVDNTGPSGPGAAGEPVMTIRQGDRELSCCETVTRDGGPLTIHVEGEDLNFSSLSLGLYGGCNVSVPIFSKTYDGDLTDRGAPSPGIDIPWDPWALGVETCCYVIFFHLYDRAIIRNVWGGGHHAQTWRSITIA